MASLLLIACGISFADQVRMLNGDVYFGTVTLLNSNALVLHSEVLGNVQLPRQKVAGVNLGASFAGNANVPETVRPSATISNTIVSRPAAVSTPAASLQQLASQTNLIRQVQGQFLAEAGPEANGKFETMMQALGSGEMNINDLRAEAKKAAAQIRELKRGLGEGDSSTLDGYLSILEKFLKDSPASEGTTSKTSAPAKE